MALGRLLGSKRARSLTAVSALVQAGRELRSGDRRIAALLLGLAALAYRSTAVGILAQGVLWWYRRRRKAVPTGRPQAEGEHATP